MVRRFASALIPLLVLLVAVTPTAAQVITNDPNTVGDNPQKVEKADERLLQPVTYQPGYKRLHDVADELTNLTGVAVRCGRNSSDWHVRDIPLTVCVNNMPLGRLLKMVAAAVHVQLASETVGKDDPTPVYRFIRTREGEKELAATDKIEAYRKLVSWAWDVMAAYGKTPDAPLEIRPEYYEECPNVKGVDGKKIDTNGWLYKRLGLDQATTKAVARVIASLGPEIKEQVLAGEQVRVRMPDFPGDALRQLYYHTCINPSGLVQEANGSPVPEPTSDEVENATLYIELRESNARSQLYFMVDGLPSANENSSLLGSTWSGYPINQARMLSYAKNLAIPPMPDADKILQKEDDPPGPEFERIITREDYGHPALQCKITPEVPQNKSRLTYAETITTLAMASGFSVISEDFVSHKNDLNPLGCDIHNFGKEVVMGPALQQASRHATQWFLDKDAKLLVGYGREWRDSHANLMPQELLSELHDKLISKGAELDDMTPLVQFTRNQIREWVTSRPDMYGLSVDMFGEDLAIWRLYDSLSPEYKKMAKSEMGFPLAKLDPVWVSSYIRKQTREARKSIMSISLDVDDGKPSPLENPEAIKQLVMRVESSPLDQWFVKAQGTPNGRVLHSQPNGMQKHGYQIVISGEYNREPIEIKEWWSRAYFPIYTPEKELELYDKADEKKQLLK